MNKKQQAAMNVQQKEVKEKLTLKEQLQQMKEKTK